MLSGKRKQNDHRSSLHHIYVFSHVNRVLVVDVPRSTLVTTLLQWAYISLGLIAGTDKPQELLSSKSSRLSYKYGDDFVDNFPHVARVLDVDSIVRSSRSESAWVDIRTFVSGMPSRGTEAAGH